ncbi:MAG: hypothetical protein N7Q72_07015, partial [Spiroplasma sp. Tabriz.8]|nr:hypothetical protein [Spiroplasma sp. Tabriz.8]
QAWPAVDVELIIHQIDAICNSTNDRLIANTTCKIQFLFIYLFIYLFIGGCCRCFCRYECKKIIN